MNKNIIYLLIISLLVILSFVVVSKMTISSKYEKTIKDFIEITNSKFDNINIKVEEIECKGYKKIDCSFYNGNIKIKSKENKKITFEKLEIENINDILKNLNLNEDILTILKSDEKLYNMIKDKLNHNDNDNKNSKLYVKGFVTKFLQSEDDIVLSFDELLEMERNQITKNNLLANKNNIVKKIEIKKKLLNNEELKNIKYNSSSNINFDFFIDKTDEKNHYLKINNISYKDKIFDYTLKDIEILNFNRNEILNNIIANFNLKLIFNLKEFSNIEKEEFNIISKIIGNKDTNFYLYNKNNDDSNYSINKKINILEDELKKFVSDKNLKNEILKLNKMQEENNINIEFKFKNDNKDNINKIMENFIKNNNKINEEFVKLYNLDLKVF